MSEVIDKLKALIKPVKKGTTGYTSLAKSERVTAHEISLLIIQVEKLEKSIT